MDYESALLDIPISNSIFIKDKEVVIYDGFHLKNNPILQNWENIVCYNLSGEFLWKVNGMHDFKYWDKNRFVGIRQIENNGLIATDFSGYVFNVDLETGKAIYQKFVK